MLAQFFSKADLSPLTELGKPNIEQPFLSSKPFLDPKRKHALLVRHCPGGGSCRRRKPDSSGSKEQCKMNGISHHDHATMLMSSSLNDDASLTLEFAHLVEDNVAEDIIAAEESGLTTFVRRVDAEL